MTNVQSQMNRTSRFKVVAALFMLLLGIGMILTAWWITSPERELKRQRARFFKTQMQPLLEKERDRNLAAIHSAKRLLDEKFARYSENVPKFTEALTSWSSKYRISKAMVRDKWNKSDETREYVISLFGEHVVSDDNLRGDFEQVVAQFRGEVEANRNLMLAEATHVLSSSMFPVHASMSNNESLSKAFGDEFTKLLSKRAKQIPGVTVLAVGGSILAEEGARIIVTAVIRIVTAKMASVATATATSAVAGTTTGAAAGAAGGTALAPGIGTAIGITVGIAVGTAVEWWMESRFKEKVTYECRSMLEEMKAGIWGTDEDGLKAYLNQLVEASREAHAKALKKVVVEGV